MTAQPTTEAPPFADEPTGFRMNYERRCTKFSTNAALLDDPTHAATLRQWLDAMSGRFGNPEQPDPALFQPYDGNPVPVFNDEPADTPVAPVVPLHPKPPAPGTDETPGQTSHDETATAQAALKPTVTGTPWPDRFVGLWPETLTDLTPEFYVRLVHMIRYINGDSADAIAKTGREDACIDPAVVAARFGVSVETLRGWLKPTTGKRKGGPLSAFVWLRVNKDGRPAYRRHEPTKHNPKAEERWLLDYNPNRMTGRFAMVPWNWLWVNPDTDTDDGSQWLPVDGVHPGAVWAGSMCLFEAKGEQPFRRGAVYLAKDYGCSEDSLLIRLNQAEDAGFITVYDRAGNGRSALRTPHRAPVDEKDRTTHTRARTGDANPVKVPKVKVDPAAERDSTPPF
jgi:hypothetical protein